MPYCKQLNELIAALTDRISYIEDTTSLFPHIVFCEEVDDNGNPCYRQYQLIRLLPDGKCMLQNPDGVTEEERDLSEINIEWLITIWERHCELLPDNIDPELLYLANSGQWVDRAMGILNDLALGTYEINYDFVHLFWQNLRCDEENIAEYRQHLKDIEWEPETNPK